MSRAKRIFFVTDTKDFTDKLLKTRLRKQIKGFIRLGHDIQVFSYNTVFWQTAPVMSKFLSRKWCKKYVDELLIKQLNNYNPDIVFVSFANFLDAETVRLMRDSALNALFIGSDCDLWPEHHTGRIDVARQLDVVTATYAGKGLDEYRKAGVRCVFLPNMCDPDIEYRYHVLPEWRSEILFTGQTRYNHKRYPGEETRYKLLNMLAANDKCRLYGCFGRPKIGGMNYLYAISGARIGLSINAVNDISMCHSDRITSYLACGTFVLAKRVPDTDLLFKDSLHLKYFDTAEEFFELADWYLNHEDERLKIADTGMQYVHKEYNCEKIAQYTLDIIETGIYSAPWTR